MSTRGHRRGIAAAVLACAVGIGGLFGLAAAVAATDSAKHFFAADGTTKDAFGGPKLTWSDRPHYAAGLSGVAGDRSFWITPSDHLTSTSADVGNFGTSDFTIRLWLRLDPSDSPPQVLVSKRTGCYAGSFWDLTTLASGGVEFEIQDSNNNFGRHVDNPTPVYDGKWHEVLIGRSGDQVGVAVDGHTTTGQTNATVVLDNQTPMMIGTDGCIGINGQTAPNVLIDNLSFGPGDAAVDAPATAPTATPSASTKPTPTHPTGSRHPHPAGRRSPSAGASTHARHRPHQHPAVRHRHHKHPPPKFLRPTATPPPTLARGAPPPSTGVTHSPAKAAVAFAHSIPSPSEAFANGKEVGEDLLAGVLLVALLSLPITIINRTSLINADHLGSAAGGLRRALRLDRLGTWIERVPILARLAMAALVAGVLYGFLQPTFGFNLSSVALALGLAAGLGALLVIRVVVQRTFLRRTYDLDATVRVFPGFAMVGLGCVVLSRLIGLQPGLLLGSLVGLVSAQQGRDAEEGHAIAVADAVVAAAIIGAYFLRSAIVDSSVAHGFGGSLLAVALTTMVAAGIQVLTFELIPIAFLEGAPLFSWSRAAWVALITFGSFGFVHLLLHPVSGGGSYLHHVSYLSYLFATYLILAIAFWGGYALRVERRETEDR
ncbi:MAG: hypothetical protein JO246_03860 [Frankiaceae bacterium]|nr:hypothetical protein [Frankiaceae bacterium]MBV9871966.1 hypothetical protein [Frankiaceae bacterium]